MRKTNANILCGDQESPKIHEILNKSSAWSSHNVCLSVIDSYSMFNFQIYAQMANISVVEYWLIIRILKECIWYPKNALWNILNIPNLLNTLISRIFHTNYFEYSDFQQMYHSQGQRFECLLNTQQEMSDFLSFLHVVKLWKWAVFWVFPLKYVHFT